MKRFPFAKVNRALAKIDSNYCRINWGGCGKMAIIIYEMLMDHVDDIKFTIAGGQYDCCTTPKDINLLKSIFPNMEMTVRAFEQHGVINDHVWVEFKWKGRWYAVDSTGIVSRREAATWAHPVHKGTLTLEEMKSYCRGRSGWNPYFDRRQVPSMRRMAEQEFSRIFG